MKVAVLAEQNFNLIDGSTIWLLNVCKLLALQPDLEVTLLLSHPLVSRILADELPAALRVADAQDIARVTGLAQPALSAATLVGTLARWEAAEGRFDRIFVRGTAYLTALLQAPDVAGRLVGYAPSAIPDLALAEPEWVTRGRAARTPFVVQSETAKQAMEALFDYPAHVVHVVPPIVFHTDALPEAKTDAKTGADARATAPATLCYSGKIDLHYGIDWLIGLCDAMAGDPALHVSLIAGKDTYRPRYPEFFAQMDAFRARIAAGRLPGVSLVTGVPHAEAKARMAEADFAYCLRHARYDDVIEISTKIVEFCTLGVAPILNDNALNRALFGDDYPYLIDIVTEDVIARVPQILRSKGTPEHARARVRIAEVAARFSASRLSGALALAIRGHATDGQALTDRPRRILIATHDGKFLRQFLDRLRGEAQVTLDWQAWASTVRPEGVPDVPQGVDTVFCEWCCENAVWHSRNKRPDTRLIVRLHRFEAFRDFPARVNWAAVDALIVVSDHFRDIMVRDHGVDPARIHVMAQYVDWHGLQRPKTPEARFTLGLVGINPFDHKRFDRAIDFLADLRARDPRFRLAVRSVMPWQIDWVWNNRADARAQFVQVFRRIYTDPLLRDAVRFDPAGVDMEEWYRGIGTILSSSDSEGCHTSVIEGMASGAYPVVYDWPGARSLFAPYVHADMAEAIGDVVAFADRPDLDTARQLFVDMTRKHDVEGFARALLNM